MPVYQVKQVDLQKRADTFLAEQLPTLSRSYIQHLLQHKKLTFNQQTITGNYKFKTAGELHLPDLILKQTSLPNLKLDILFEDDYLVVINKPHGILTHGKSLMQAEVSIASALRQYCHWPALQWPTTKTQLRQGIVHRLDKETSGILLAAKNDLVVQQLQDQFRNRQVLKTYLGLVKRGQLPNQALIDKPIMRNPRHKSLFTVAAHGKPAQTLFKLQTQSEQYYLLEIKPQTGRTHQIRVHLASLNHPIIGDNLYGGMPAERLMLHAHKISFKHPVSNKNLDFTVPAPAIFQTILGKTLK